MDDPARLVADANAAFFLAAAAASPGGRVLDLGGVTAGVVPAAPERPVMNSAFCESPGGVTEEAYQRLAEGYRDAGVAGWTVWVHPDDEASAAVLAAHGHVPDARPRLMWAPAAAIAGRPRLAGDLAPAELLPLAELNDAVYGYPGSFTRALGPVGSVEGWSVAVVHVDGEAAAVGAACEADSDCYITLVATLPDHRGRGLASGIIRHLVADAADRGCATTTLVATRAGAPVYERLGYRDVGWLGMWERR